MAERTGKRSGANAASGFPEGKTSEITIADVLTGICDALDSEFGYPVYPEEIPQGFKEPCFFVEAIQSSQRRIGRHRHKRRQTFCIHFFPPEEGGNKEDILVMTEKLYFLLEYIRANGNLCRGTGLKHKADGGVLHFFVDYDYHLITIPEPDPFMKHLEHKGELKYV